MYKKANILLVDDEVNTLQMYSLLLRKEGYLVKDFLSPLDALAYLRFTKQKFDLIITDLNMPFLDGLKLLDEVRKVPDFLSVPFIFLSAIDDKNFHLKAYQKGAIDYIQKPISNDIFLAKIESILKSYHLHSLNNNIILKGDDKKLDMEQIIAYCEEERLSGFALIRYQNKQAVITFEQGALKEIEVGLLSGTAAFEQISSWQSFKFMIIRGEYTSGLIRAIEDQFK